MIALIIVEIVWDQQNHHISIKKSVLEVNLTGRSKLSLQSSKKLKPNNSIVDDKVIITADTDGDHIICHD